MVTSTGIIIPDAMFDGERRKWSVQIMMFSNKDSTRALVRRCFVPDYHVELGTDFGNSAIAAEESLNARYRAPAFKVLKRGINLSPERSKGSLSVADVCPVVHIRNTRIIQ